jgi:hypothetical protein
MLLDEGSSPAAVLDELHHLLTQLKGHADNLARINKYQQLFQVGGPLHDSCGSCACLKSHLWHLQHLCSGLSGTDAALLKEASVRC